MVTRTTREGPEVQDLKLPEEAYNTNESDDTERAGEQLWTSMGGE